MSQANSQSDCEPRSSTSIEKVWFHSGLRLLSIVRVRTIRPSRTYSCVCKHDTVSHHSCNMVTTHTKAGEEEEAGSKLRTSQYGSDLPMRSLLGRPAAFTTCSGQQTTHPCGLCSAPLQRERSTMGCYSCVTKRLQDWAVVTSCGRMAHIDLQHAKRRRWDAKVLHDREIHLVGIHNDHFHDHLQTTTDMGLEPCGQ
jgi:hypothetical protein